MGTEIAVNKFKFMPEIAVQTNTEDLTTDGDEKIRLKSLNRQQQLVMPFEYGVDSVDQVLVQHVLDNSKEPELDSGSLRGIADSVNNRIKSNIPYAYIFEDYRLNLNNNTGGTSADYRTRLFYAIKELTTVRKLVNNRSLNPRDRAAMEVLRASGLDVASIVAIGMRIPRNFTTGLDDQSIASFQRALGAAVNLVTNNRQEVANINVDPGTCAVLNSISFTVPIQAQAREVSILITRDDDNDLISIDPAAFSGSKVEVPLFIPSYENLKVEVLQISGVHNNFKAQVGIEVKKVGLATKARLLEFSGEFFPPQLPLTDEDIAAIEELHLRELARVGATSVLSN